MDNGELLYTVFGVMIAILLFLGPPIGVYYFLHKRRCYRKARKSEYKKVGIGRVNYLIIIVAAGILGSLLIIYGDPYNRSSVYNVYLFATVAMAYRFKNIGFSMWWAAFGLGNILAEEFGVPLFDLFSAWPHIFCLFCPQLVKAYTKSEPRLKKVSKGKLRIASGNSDLGELDIPAIKLKIKNLEIAPNDLYFDKSTNEWRNLSEAFSFEETLSDPSRSNHEDQREIYIYRDGEEYGPFQSKDIPQLISEDRLCCDDYIRFSTSGGWNIASENLKEHFNGTHPKYQDRGTELFRHKNLYILVSFIFIIVIWIVFKPLLTDNKPEPVEIADIFIRALQDQDKEKMINLLSPKFYKDPSQSVNTAISELREVYGIKKFIMSEESRTVDTAIIKIEFYLGNGEITSDRWTLVLDESRGWLLEEL